MALPSSLSKLKKIGFCEEEYTMEGVKFVLKNITSKEHKEILNSTAPYADEALRWEMIKQKTLQYSIQSVDGQQVNNEELLKFFEECNPNIINYLFNKYLEVANKAAELVDASVEKIELAETNLPDFTGQAKTQPASEPQVNAETE